MKKKKDEIKKKVQEGWMGAHLPVLGHDTGNCVTPRFPRCDLCYFTILLFFFFSHHESLT